ncbi:DNA replication/repair protein RecF [Altererythrobacter sp. CAU 1778]
MALDRITLTDFRNHATSSLVGMGRFNLLVGENGAGKTNVLEAISLLAPGRGMRRAALPDMVRFGGTGGFAISADLLTVPDSEAVRLATGTRADRPGRRIVNINGAEKPANVLGEWLSLSWLTPSMDGLFMASAGERRRFLDRLVLAVDPAHARHAARYENALRERNRLLSDERAPDPAWLDGIEKHMAQHGGALIAGRALLVERLGNALDGLPDEPFARPALTLLAERPAQPDDLLTFWKDARSADRAAGRTRKGPHRDDLAVTMASKAMPAAACSTGEQKAMLIAITLAHAGLSASERPQVLLLDEVAAHLDPVRREALFARLSDSGAQVWITGTESAPFEAISADSARWRVTGGSVVRL